MGRVTGPAPLSVEAVAGRLQAVHGRLQAAGAADGRVRIVAVTKGFGRQAVEAAAALGLLDVGENYAPELLSKAGAPDLPGGLRWHFLGAVQRNKVRRLAPVVHLWQGVARLVEGEEIARRAPGAGVLVEVEVAGLPDRRGVPPRGVAALVEGLRRLELDVRGLMAVGRPGPPEGAREGFRVLARLARDLGLREVSMGMSEDLEVAVEEGATMVRLGRCLFGPRPARPEVGE